MPFKEIFNINLDAYKSVYWEGEPVYEKYDFLQNFLKKELGQDYAYLLAMPKIKKNTATWLCKNNHSISIEQLEKEDKLEAENILNTRLTRIGDLIQKLNASEKTSSSLGLLLDLSFQVPDESHIYYDRFSKEVCLVGWGFTYYDNAKSNNKTKLIKKKTFHDISAKEQPFDKGSSVDVKNTISSLNNNKQSFSSNSNIKDENPVSTSSSGNNPPPRKTNRFGFLTWLFGGLFLLALLFIIYLLKDKVNDKPDYSQIGIPNTERNPPEYNNPPDLPQASPPVFNKPYLPEQPDVLPPVDTTKIIIDEEDPLKQTIISNRLNLYLSKGTNIDAFGKKFKQIFPDKDINIVYYTAAANRVMIQFPSDIRSSIKKRLEADFKNIEFILDESIFMNKKKFSSFDDPGFNENKKIWHLDRVQVDEAWKVTKGDPNVIIAVIDDGFDILHPELKNQTYQPWNIPANKRKTDTGRTNMVHGTHVASIAGAEANNLEGIAGVAPKCKIMPIQVGNQRGIMTTSAIVDALFYALNNDANIINLSLGSIYNTNLSKLPFEEQEAYSKTLYLEQEKFWTDLFKLFDQKGIVVVQAAGNSNVLTSIDPMQRNPYTIKVSATNNNNNKASFSNFGNVCKLSAPGTQIYSAVPNNKYSYLDGTSMAAPIVSGAVGLLMSASPNMKPSKYREILFDTGLEVGSNIGRLIQLGIALGNIPDNENPCEEEIEKLKEEMEKLKDQLKDTTQIGLIIPENPQDFSFAEGHWRSTTDLYSTINTELIQLYFKFNSDTSGEITILEDDGTKCFAPLSIVYSSSSMDINQATPAMCADGNGYNPYSIKCQSEKGSVATCHATNLVTLDKVDFQLQKIKQF